MKQVTHDLDLHFLYLLLVDISALVLEDFPDVKQSLDDLIDLVHSKINDGVKGDIIQQYVVTEYDESTYEGE